jgi:hypothetical protein
VTEEGFGPRLRRERQRRQIALQSIAANTKIGIGLLEGLERDDVSRWPSGIFRRSFIREYAEAIGLDPVATMQEFLERFPDPAGDVPREPAPPKGQALRLVLADDPLSRLEAQLRADWQPRCLAAAIDIAATLALALGAFLAFRAFWVPWTVAAVLYYSGSVVLLGSTPGVHALSLARRRTRTRDRLTANAQMQVGAGDEASRRQDLEPASLDPGSHDPAYV